MNGQSFEQNIKYARAVDLLKSVCHLSITLKSNLLTYQDMLHAEQESGKTGKPRKYNSNLLLDSEVKVQ